MKKTNKQHRNENTPHHSLKQFLVDFQRPRRENVFVNYN